MGLGFFVGLGCLGVFFVCFGSCGVLFVGDFVYLVGLVFIVLGE